MFRIQNKHKASVVTHYDCNDTAILKGYGQGVTKLSPLEISPKSTLIVP